MQDVYRCNRCGDEDRRVVGVDAPPTGVCYRCKIGKYEYITTEGSGGNLIEEN